MKNNLYKLLPAIVIGAMLLTGCSSATAQAEIDKSSVASQTYSVQETASKTDSTVSDSSTDSETEEYFSSRDLSGEIDYTDAVEIELNGNSIKASSSDVSISGSSATITKEGTYILSGTLNDGSIVVNVGKEEKVQLVLNGVSINSESYAPIYIKQADKVFITLADGTENTLSNGGTFIQTDDNNVDAVIYAKDDVTLNGTGSLTISSPAGKGVSAKDDLTITNGNYEITSSKTALSANDNIAVADGTFKISSDADGMNSHNSDDDSLGNIYISGGEFNISVADDGIQATALLQIDGGTLNITAAEGLESTYIVINGGTISINASDDGINAAQKSSQYTPTIEVNGGDITVVIGSGDTDGFDSNGDIIINGGNISVTGNSTFDYNGTGTINGGTVIANGQQITTMPNQMMGGHGGMSSGMTGGMGGHGGMIMNGDTTDSGSFDGNMHGHGGMGGHGAFNGESVS